MDKMLALKVYDVDYSFIIKNYLDERLWEKEWTIFTYKRYEITLKLDSINVRTKTIWFEVTIKDNSEENKNYWLKSIKDSFKYSLSIENVDILKKTLNHTIFSLIQKLELEGYIEYTNRHYELKEMQNEEREKLEEIARDFLDQEGVSNDEIREAYIEYYIDKNEEVYRLISNYENDMKYKVITDFYVTFLEATNDKERLEIIRQKIGQDELEKTLKKIEDYKEYMETEEFEDDMKSNLEEI